MLKRQTLTSQVIDHLLNLIRSKAVKPGEKLPTEKQLSASLGVSRTCVREAMKSLESLRLVVLRPKIGAVLVEPSEAAFAGAEHLSAALQMGRTDMLIEFRQILEVGMVMLAADRATEEDFRAMEAAIHDHEQALREGKPAYTADLAFHNAIAVASQNSISAMALKMLSQRLADQRQAAEGIPNSAKAGLKDHRKILQAIKERKPEKARLLMSAHLREAERHWRIAGAAANDKTLQSGESLLPRQGRESDPARMS